MATNSIKFFLQGDGAAMLWDPVANEVKAMAIDGVFATARKAVADELAKQGYREIDRAALAELGFTAPAKADRTDYTVRDSKRYTMF